jgi:hypothetical protein
MRLSASPKTKSQEEQKECKTSLGRLCATLAETIIISVTCLACVTKKDIRLNPSALKGNSGLMQPGSSQAEVLHR